jgi:hypothetical protein
MAYNWGNISDNQIALVAYGNPDAVVFIDGNVVKMAGLADYGLNNGTWTFLRHEDGETFFANNETMPKIIKISYHEDESDNSVDIGDISVIDFSLSQTSAARILMRTFFKEDDNFYLLTYSDPGAQLRLMKVYNNTLNLISYINTSISNTLYQSAVEKIGNTYYMVESSGKLIEFSKYGVKLPTIRDGSSQIIIMSYVSPTLLNIDNETIYVGALSLPSSMLKIVSYPVYAYNLVINNDILQRWDVVDEQS